MIHSLINDHGRITNTFSKHPLKLMKDYGAEDKVLTGVLFIDETTQELHEIMKTTKTPLRNLTEKELCPGADARNKLNDFYR